MFVWLVWKVVLVGSWFKFGKFIGEHMSIVAPACVILGVLFPDVCRTWKPLVPYLFAIMTFQGALNNTLSSVAHVFRHPRNMLAMLVVTIVLMPACACALAKLIFSDGDIITGVTLEYCVPVAVVSFMWCDIYDGNRALSLASILTSTVLAPFTIPLSLQILLGETVQVDVLGMMGDMLFMIALPALAGMLVNDLTHGWGCNELSPKISPFAKIMMMLNMMANSTGMSEYVRHLNGELVGAVGFIFVFANCGFLLGLALSRIMHASPATMISMLFGVGLRNISAGAVIASQYFPGEVVFPVMMGTLIQQILAGVYGGAAKHLLASGKDSGKEA